MTEAELIQTRLLQIAQELVDLGSHGPKPSYSKTGPKGSQSVSWAEYRNSLLAEQKQLREQLVKASGPHTTFA